MQEGGKSSIIAGFTQNAHNLIPRSIDHMVKMYCVDALCKIVWNSIIEKKASSSGF